MKTEIIAMLAFPRKLMGGNIPLETCEHAGNFSSSDTGCLVCETRLECEWLYCNDEAAAITEKPLNVVTDALASAVLYVDACVTRAGHDARTCHCQACDWLKRARRLHQSAEHLLE